MTWKLVTRATVSASPGHLTGLLNSPSIKTPVGNGSMSNSARMACQYWTFDYITNQTISKGWQAANQHYVEQCTSSVLLLLCIYAIQLLDDKLWHKPWAPKPVWVQLKCLMWEQSDSRQHYQGASCKHTYCWRCHHFAKYLDNLSGK